MFFNLLAANGCAIALAIGSILLAANGINGWGWMLFCAVLCTTSSFTVKTDKYFDDKE